jgi:uncharacterized membrane protein YgdD (TMEM256/DUF423 family)
MHNWFALYSGFLQRSSFNVRPTISITMPAGSDAMSPRIWIIVGALSAAIGVGLGAYHAHGLEKRLAAQELPSEKIVAKLHDFEVGVRYQMYHALALVLVGIIGRQSPSRGLNIAGWLFIAGSMLFCGCLYVPVLTGTKLPWYLVPSGGLAFIVGWVALAVCSFSTPAALEVKR